MKVNTVVCPHCETIFTSGDSRQYEQHRAVYLLNKHGMSLRAISRLFGWTSPEQARVRLEVYKKRLPKEEI